MFLLFSCDNLKDMETLHWILPAGLMVLGAGLLLQAAKTDSMNIATGKQAFSTTATLKSGQAHKITAKDLPKPGDTPSGRSGGNGSRPAGAMPQAPAGFQVSIYVDEGLTNPRQIRRAPNGDYFVADTNAGEVKVFRGISAQGKPQEQSVYVTGLRGVFGLNFYPPGPNPQWIYLSTTTAVLRVPYKNGDLKASAMPQTLISDLPSGGHSTRDLVFSKDGKSMFVAVGSGSNNSDNQAEFHRANILEYTPEGKFVGIFASGIRNPVGLAINPETGDVWTSINERDTYGDNLVPDYVTHVERGGFYGWPWFYIGGNYDPAHQGKHPELKDKVIVPDVLVQAHSASLGMTFYDGKMFPAEYSGDAFACEHGSWNHAAGSGHEVIRIPLEKGKATGVYQDFLTGFSTNGVVWGRPVGVVTATDGSLLVTDDGARVIWRVAYGK